MNRFFISSLFLVPAFGLAQGANSAAPFASPVARLTAPVREDLVVPIRGNVHPLAQSQFDQGRAPADMAAERMLLLLRGSPEQEAANQQLLKDQQTPSSPKYHHWLTSEEFGAQFGPAQQDIDVVTSWLRNRGFRVDNVAKGHRIIEFSGTIGQVEQAFHTEIHQFSVNGAVYFANSQDPSIPVALSPVVSGVASLHGFFSKPLHHRSSTPAIPLGEAGVIAPFTSLTDGSHALSPSDLATIYNFKSLWKEYYPQIGNSVAVTGRSNINLQDVAIFGQLFGDGSITHVIVNGTNPGNLGGDEELEADLDVEWAGAVAATPNLNFVVSASTAFSDGIALSAEYIVDNQVGQVMSTSFGSCESDLGATGNQFWASLWQQAATEGISVFVAAGDNGSAGCDGDGITTPAQSGLAVNGLASTPYNVAVGGTKFNENGSDWIYWSNGNDPYTQQSVTKYIPEVAWNESGPDPNSSYYVIIGAGSGGVSSVYSTPDWQAGAGVPASDPQNSRTPGQRHRYLPDLSLTAASGHDPYLVVQENNLLEVGGTSASAPAMAGIMALINVSTVQVAGNPNPRFYELAVDAPQVFHDTPAGSSNAVPCATHSPNCSAQTGTANGVMNGYNTAAGFDLATGLGSVDVTALANAWSTVPATPTAIVLTTPSTTVGARATFPVTATVTSASGTPTGFVAFYDQHDPSFALGYVALNGNGVAQFSDTYGFSEQGQNGITAKYTGTAFYAASTGSLAFTAVAYSTTVLTASPVAAPLGGTITLTATVGGACLPVGPVSFFDGATMLGTATLNPDNSASLAVSSPGQGPHSLTAAFSGSGCAPSTSAPITVYVGEDAGATGVGLRFVPITPCRVADTRDSVGPFGGPALPAGSTREFDLSSGVCGIPDSAVAYSLNVTAAPVGPLGFLTIFPAGQSQPVVSTLNSDGRVKSNAAIVPAGSNGGVNVFVTDATHVILDVNGYFVPANTSSSLAFFPLTPCRVADTRGSAGALGGPSLGAGGSRAFPVLASGCNVPSNAQAYSLNMTALPHGSLGWITAWPTGQAQAGVSTLNAYTGTVTANAAIVPAGTGGAISVFTSDSTDLLIDINGYFAPPASGGLSLYTLTPCRILDTRQAPNATPIVNSSTVTAAVSTCGVLPGNAQGYLMNATVVPTGALGWLSLWPDGQPQPSVSTLNAYDAAVTSNMAVVPSTNGSIDAFVSAQSHLILDLFAYFAP